MPEQVRFRNSDELTYGTLVERIPGPEGSVFRIQVEGEDEVREVPWDRMEGIAPGDRPYLEQLRDYANRGWAPARAAAGWAVDGVEKLDAYRTEVREMRLEIVALLEVWDELIGGLDPGHLYLTRRTREVLEARMRELRERWGYDVVREDRDGAPFPDQPRDWGGTSE